MAVAGTAVAAFDNLTRHWRVTITGVTPTNTSPVFTGKGYQIGMGILTGTLTTPSVTLQGSIDGVTFVNLGAAITTVPPYQFTLSTPDITSSSGVFAFFQILNSSATGNISAVIDFVSQNMS